MNIAAAKEQIRKTCIAYLTKDEFGNYVMPVETQRPVFLLGAPGIGKTAIMAQIADELDLALVDYSTTHHTRQSAIGLPFISHRSFDGREFDVSEYTMSEIIASVYAAMERTGKREGILFLDEVNCVSETLEPAMLRFLQSKVFGTHRVPDGWVVVSAGNPTEFNRNAHQFDVVTLDRVKRIEVEPDYQAWRTFAVATQAHPAIVSYLDLKPDNFYRMETRGRSRDFVTARAWMDLSNMMRLYNRNDLAIDGELVAQYVQVSSVAKDFTAYLDLFAAYQQEYDIPAILEGRPTDEARARMASANFDEQMAVTGLLSDALSASAGDVLGEREALSTVRGALMRAKGAAGETENGAPSASCASLLEAEAAAIKQDVTGNALHYRQNPAVRASQCAAAEMLGDLAAIASNTNGDPFPLLGKTFNARLTALQGKSDHAQQQFESAITFVAETSGTSNALIVLLSELSMNTNASRFIGTYGCDAYREHSQLLKLDERLSDLENRLAALDERLDDKQQG